MQRNCRETLVLTVLCIQSKPGEVEHAVEYALKEAGYKLVDTAGECEIMASSYQYWPKSPLLVLAAYGNEVEVGQGIKVRPG